MHSNAMESVAYLYIIVNIDGLWTHKTTKVINLKLQ